MTSLTCGVVEHRYPLVGRDHLMRLAPLLGLLLLASNCSTMDVKTEYNRSAQFGKYRTYGWLANPARGHPADLLRGSPTEQQIKAHVDRPLIARGIMPAAAGQQPDFLVGYHAALREKLDVYDTGYGWGYAGLSPALQAHTYTQGTL